MSAKPHFETWWDIERLIPYENNVKIHDPKQVAKIAASIREFGWTTAIVVDKDGVIIAGHGRRLAALELGEPRAPVVVRSDLTEDQVKALRLADNRVAISATDGDKLKLELADIDLDLDGIFDKKELEFLQADLAVIDTDKIMTDIDAAVREQTTETLRKIADADEKDVPIAKVLGFKSIKTKDEKHVATFLAWAENETGKTGAQAFVEIARRAVAGA